MPIWIQFGSKWSPWAHGPGLGWLALAWFGWLALAWLGWLALVWFGLGPLGPGPVGQRLGPGPYGPMGPYGPIWAHFGPILGPYGSIWAQLGPNWAKNCQKIGPVGDSYWPCGVGKSKLPSRAKVKPAKPSHSAGLMFFRICACIFNALGN